MPNNDFHSLSSKEIRDLLVAAAHREKEQTRQDGVDVLAQLFTERDRTTQQIVDGLEQAHTDANTTDGEA